MIVNGQRLSACMVGRQVSWVGPESEASVTVALMEEVPRANVQHGGSTHEPSNSPCSLGLSHDSAPRLLACLETAHFTQAMVREARAALDRL